LRPFRTSVTYRNLKRTGEGVLHVTDDVELIARAAVGQLETLPPFVRSEHVDGVILTGACRWYAFSVESLDDSQERTAIFARVVEHGRVRDFFGFNRAKHAVIEAAILATRIELLDANMILAEFERLAAPVIKTGGTEELRAFEFLQNYVHGKLNSIPSPRGRRKGEGALPANSRPHPGPLPEGEGGDAAALTAVIHVRTPCRLHFGMFSFGHVDRPQFGGVGVMVDPPAVDVTMTRAARFNISGSHRERAREFAELAVASWGLPTLPPCQINVHAPSDHVGLGVGTQLGLSVAAGLRRFLQLPELTIEEIAADVGRASRSAVGTYGFQFGGLIVDAGQAGLAHPTTTLRGMVGGAHTTRLKRRLDIPDAWRFVLVRPKNEYGLAGASELDAFARLPPVPEQTTQRLWQIAEDEMLPALDRADCDAFGEAVYCFGRLAGECFAAVQGGPFANSEIARLVDVIRLRGVAGVGQSSWGPTVFAILPSQTEADALAKWLRDHSAADRYEITIANPNNEGAIIR
jgi:beta-RFAP synthase